jgi:ATP-dependent helicase HepA
MREAMNVVASSELGNAALGRLKHPKIKPGSVLLEAVFGVDCLAPASLELGRFLPMTPIRMVITPEGKNVANAIGHEALNKLLEPVPPTTSANVIRQIKPLLQQQINKAEQIAERALELAKKTATNALIEQLGAERDRLCYLSQVNPAVKDAEIEALDQRRQASENAIADARIVQQALRVIIAT